MRSVLFALITFTVSLGFAATKQEVAELLRVTRQSLQFSDVTPAQLDEVAALLTEAKDILDFGSNDDKAACVQFAFEKYNVSNTSSVAMDKASAACRIISDLQVARFAFDRYNVSNTTSVAMDKAAEAANLGTAGKLPIVEFAFDKYNVSNTTTVAMDRAAAGAKMVSRNSLDCLRTAFDRYNVSNTASVAMDKSFEACR